MQLSWYNQETKKVMRLVINTIIVSNIEAREGEQVQAQRYHITWFWSIRSTKSGEHNHNVSLHSAFVKWMLMYIAIVLNAIPTNPGKGEQFKPIFTKTTSDCVIPGSDTLMWINCTWSFASNTQGIRWQAHRQFKVCIQWIVIQYIWYHSLSTNRKIQTTRTRLAPAEYGLALR